MPICFALLRGCGPYCNTPTNLWECYACFIVVKIYIVSIVKTLTHVKTYLNLYSNMLGPFDTVVRLSKMTVASTWYICQLIYFIVNVYRGCGPDWDTGRPSWKQSVLLWILCVMFVKSDFISFILLIRIKMNVCTLFQYKFAMYIYFCINI